MIGVSDRLPSPDDWSEVVTPDNVGSLPLEHGFFAAPLGRVLRPVGITAIVSRGIEVPTLLAADEDGDLRKLPVDWIPHMRRFFDSRATVQPPDGNLATLHHRKGNAAEREARLRVLRLTPDSTASTHPVTLFRHGESPDHPDEKGFYIVAEDVGATSVRGIADGSTKYLSPDTVEVKHFPIDPWRPTA